MNFGQCWQGSQKLHKQQWRCMLQQPSSLWRQRLTSTGCLPPPCDTESTCHASWPAAPAEDGVLSKLSCCQAALTLHRSIARPWQGAQQAFLKARHKVVKEGANLHLKRTLLKQVQANSQALLRRWQLSRCCLAASPGEKPFLRLRQLQHDSCH